MNDDELHHAKKKQINASSHAYKSFDKGLRPKKL